MNRRDPPSPDERKSYALLAIGAYCIVVAAALTFIAYHFIHKVP